MGYEGKKSYGTPIKKKKKKQRSKSRMKQRNPGSSSYSSGAKYPGKP